MKPLLINCDMGEGIGNDAAIMQWIQCCNLACGGHAGDSSTMRATAKKAQECGVYLGAHPSYPDRENFGRKSMNLSEKVFKSAIQSQLRLFEEIADEATVPWHHVKAHGALYHDGYQNEKVSHWLLEVLSEFEFEYLFCPSNSLIFQLSAQYAIKPLAEGFLDRRYDEEGRLVARNIEGAVLDSKEAILSQLQRFWFRSEVTTAEGNHITIPASTFCLHGDHPGCAEAAQTIQQWYGRLSH